MKFIMIAGVVATLSSSLMAATKPLQWSIKHKTWSAEHEKDFSEFVNKVGKARANNVCHTTEQCLRSPIANPKYAEFNPPNLGSTYTIKKEIDGKVTPVKQFGIFSDCADLPFILRAYFAWMNDLPLTYPSSISPQAENAEYRNLLLEQVKVLEAKYEMEKNYAGSSGPIDPYFIQQEINYLNERRNGMLNQYSAWQQYYQQYQYEYNTAYNEYNQKGGMFKKAKLDSATKRFNDARINLENVIAQLRAIDTKIQESTMRLEVASKNKNKGVLVGGDSESLANIQKEIASLKNGPLSIRYTKYGNKINSNSSVKPGDDINNVMVRLRDTISSAHFRVRTDTWEGNGFPSFYSPAITNEAIVPGTVLYDIDGHVAMVYEVTKDGEVLAIDAHPDNSLSRMEFNSEFNRSPIFNSGGFLNWRPSTIEGSSIKPASNSSLAAEGKLSYEQYLGNVIVASEGDDDIPDHKKAVFAVDQTGQRVNFYEFVAARLRDPNAKVNPVESFKKSLNFICENYKARATAVNDAIGAGLTNQPHPNKLPANIYGTEGDWEVYATPSSDLRRRISLFELANKTKKMVQAVKLFDPIYDYSGSNIVADLMKAYNNEANQCKVSVKKSNGQKVEITLASIMSNVYKFSFDPYHCAELRWGIYTDADAEACTRGSSDKIEWYKSEQRLRNSLERETDVLTNLNFSELAKSSVGTSKQTELDVKKVLESL